MNPINFVRITASSKEWKVEYAYINIINTVVYLIIKYIYSVDFPNSLKLSGSNIENSTLQSGTE